MRQLLGLKQSLYTSVAMATSVVVKSGILRVGKSIIMPVFPAEARSNFHREFTEHPHTYSNTHTFITQLRASVAPANNYGVIMCFAIKMGAT